MKSDDSAQILLVGDDNQLPPTGGQPGTASVALGEALFARLLNFVRANLFDTQYRMHPYMAEWSSKEFYGGLLRSHDGCWEKTITMPKDDWFCGVGLKKPP